jgi:hypothetical protein
MLVLRSLHLLSRYGNPIQSLAHENMHLRRREIFSDNRFIDDEAEHRPRVARSLGCYTAEQYSGLTVLDLRAEASLRGRASRSRGELWVGAVSV